eukprot:gene18287-21954_t
MDLLDHAGKISSSLSGGNRRKLSVAVATMHDPAVLFLDEPSTGMDPVARRFMWRVISRLSTRCSVMLTTHSMEEAEALCHRIGIMVNGQLRCLGSAQHLKNRFGRGVELTIKVALPHDDTLRSMAETIRHLVTVGGAAAAAAGASAAGREKDPQYLLEEEQFAQDLYFVSYDKAGQNPLLHVGAGVHFQ